MRDGRSVGDDAKEQEATRGNSMTRPLGVRKPVLVPAIGAVLLGFLAAFSCQIARRAAAEPGARAGAEIRGGWSILTDRARVEAANESGHWVLLGTCPGGIGGLTLRCESHLPAESLRLRLRYAPGRPFREVEGLEVEAGERRIATRYTPRRADTAAAAAGCPALTFRETADYLEVEIPPDVMAGGRGVTIRWVDYYR